ncbi:hypothetical protein [Antarctobacter heliothermus]|nr:hypothetical protein [Antarctobacter heliothermus]
MHDARTAGLVKLHCGKGFIAERQEWAGTAKAERGYSQTSVGKR